MSEQASALPKPRYKNSVGQVFFLIWGILGFIFSFGLWLHLVTTPEIGVGSSTYIGACFVFWIGGMIFFALTDLVFKARRLAQ